MVIFYMYTHTLYTMAAAIYIIYMMAAAKGGIFWLYLKPIK